MPIQLVSLRIRNLALVEDLTWSLTPGFTAITGETGSGKSMIVGGLKLLIGERADRTLIRTGADSCTVEAIFEAVPAEELNRVLSEIGVEPCEEGQLLLKRVVTSAGTNRQFVNGSPATLASLQSLSKGLVDLHGPHDHQSLLSPELQRALLDAFSGSSVVLGEYKAAFSKRNALHKELEELCGDEAAFERECALLSHQSSEIEAAQLRPNEEEQLHAQYAVASQSRRLLELSSQALARLSESDDSVVTRVSELARTIRELERIDPSCADISAAHVRAITELEELSSSLQRYTDSLDLDPSHLRELEDRLNLLESLKRKYGAAIEEVIAFGKNAAQRLLKLSSRADERSRIQTELKANGEQLLKVGGKLSALRAKSAPLLSKQAVAELRGLGFKKAEFDIQLTPTPKPNPSGLENVEFLFAPNLGEPSKPLQSIASSGEISRVMLALKSALAEQDMVPLLVFDEIDANVGGEIAHAVGEKMRALGKRRQVLCISHLPQVASKADTHFVVAKEEHDGRTISTLEQVQDEARKMEIARMLGGKTSSSLALAETLLARSQA
jgi:DNA repair protein RecN (Recombination protein N)